MAAYVDISLSSRNSWKVQLDCVDSRVDQSSAVRLRPGQQSSLGRWSLNNRTDTFHLLFLIYFSFHFVYLLKLVGEE
jgi:hypothetical protein